MQKNTPNQTKKYLIPKQFKYLLVNILLSVLIISLAFLVYTQTRFYLNFLGTSVETALKILFVPYIIINVGYFLYCAVNNQDLSNTKLSLIYNFLRSKILNIFRPREKLQHTQETEADKAKIKTAFLSVLVKFFFFPIMLSTVLANGTTIVGIIRNISSEGIKNLEFNTAYSYILTIIFFFDTLIFAFGYAIESKELKSEIRSVEPTFLGWFVALCTYPPFNNYTGQILQIPIADSTFQGSGILQILHINLGADFNLGFFHAVRIITILCYLIYLWATFALGTKSSNLTNRGIVAKGPYKFVRHPAYISKNIAWWLETLLSMTNWQVLLPIIGWNIIYFFRARTEENHLSKDPDYLKYKKKVKFMFIPKVV